MQTIRTTTAVGRAIFVALAVPLLSCLQYVLSLAAGQRARRGPHPAQDDDPDCPGGLLHQLAERR